MSETSQDQGTGRDFMEGNSIAQEVILKID